MSLKPAPTSDRKQTAVLLISTAMPANATHSARIRDSVGRSDRMRRVHIVMTTMPVVT